jgi:hypothetical protein
MAELADLDPLRNLSKLTHLVLLENPVTRKEVSILFVLSHVLSLSPPSIMLPTTWYFVHQHLGALAKRFHSTIAIGLSGGSPASAF